MKIRIVFLCVENSNRSQMAEALARLEGGVEFEVYSAGSSPLGRINPTAIEAMHELGYDLSKHRSKSIAELPRIRFDVAVTMGCGEDCPTLLTRQHVDWNIPDPKHLPMDQFRQVRDLIAKHVSELLSSLRKGMPASDKT